MDSLMTVSEVATVFHVSEKTVERWVANGKLKRFKCAKVSRFLASDVETFLRAHTRATRQKVDGLLP